MRKSSALLLRALQVIWTRYFTSKPKWDQSLRKHPKSIWEASRLRYGRGRCVKLGHSRFDGANKRPSNFSGNHFDAYWSPNVLIIQVFIIPSGKSEWTSFLVLLSVFWCSGIKIRSYESCTKVFRWGAEPHSLYSIIETHIAVYGRLLQAKCNLADGMASRSETQYEPR